MPPASAWEYALKTPGGEMPASNKDWLPLPSVLNGRLSVEDPRSVLGTSGCPGVPLFYDRLLLKQALPEQGSLVYYWEKDPDDLYVFRKIPKKIIRIAIVSMSKKGFSFQIYNAFTGELYPTKAGTFGLTDTRNEFMARVHDMLCQGGCITTATALHLDIDWLPGQHARHALKREIEAVTGTRRLLSCFAANWFQIHN